MRFVFSIFLLSSLLFQCKKEEKNIDAIDIINEYIENPVFGISNIIYINSDFIFPKANEKTFSVKSYFDKKEISFHKSNKVNVPDFTKITFVKADFQSIKKLNNTGSEFYTISKPVLSEDKNYAILETGVFNYQDKGFTKNNISKLPDIIHVFLYKKENGNWKRLELITQIRL